MERWSGGEVESWIGGRGVAGEGRGELERWSGGEVRK